MPAWVCSGFDEYQKRLPAHLKFKLKEFDLALQADAATRKAHECTRMLDALPGRAHVVALTETGTPFSSAQLAEKIASWLQIGRELVFVIGGPDGLAPALLARADVTFSLSALTLPHALVRVLLSEQIYRAHSILVGHPYHRV